MVGSMREIPGDDLRWATKHQVNEEVVKLLLQPRSSFFEPAILVTTNAVIITTVVVLFLRGFPLPLRDCTVQPIIHSLQIR